MAVQGKYKHTVYTSVVQSETGAIVHSVQFTA